ncbi:MAG: leucine-rich repeat protein [Clostridia bacterium]|nr:leucine-rich repeat protein [Clostridia bacterium]
MKKFLSVLLCLMLGVLLVVGFASCDEEAPPAPPVFKVNFIVDGTTQTTAEATGTEAITLPEEPTKKGYAFEGWFLDDGTWQQPFDASAPRSGDVSVYAKWVELPPPDLSISSQTLTLKDDKLTATFANEIDAFSFINDLAVADGAAYVIASDRACTKLISSKTVDLKAGNNTYFVLVTNGDAQKLYTVTIRRRPIYTVSFNVGNGGTAVESQKIEEGELATEPTAPSRTGYVFLGWDYDFTKPIAASTTVKALWRSLSDIPYRVEYYIQNLENDEYTLLENETEELIGATGETVNAEQKTFDHVTLDTSKSTLSGTVSGDGSLVLKVYYTRSVYTLSVSGSAYGSVTGVDEGKMSKDYKTGFEPFTSTANYNTACVVFLGWFSENECISTETTYHFAVDRNVQAKFAPKENMAAFSFSATATSCTISGLKDRTVTEITIPDCVTAIGFTAFSSCKNLTSIDIHSNIISIGNLAFYGCTSLSEISIAPSVQSIGSNAFDGCSALTQISIPEGVAVIGDSTFRGCKKLASVTIPASVRSIGSYAFQGCSDLASVSFATGSRLTSIGGETFHGCTSLASITLPEELQSIGNSAFGACSALEVITLPASLQTVGDSMFDNCGILTTVNFGGSRDRWEMLIEGIDIGLKPGCTVNYEYTED